MVTGISLRCSPARRRCVTGRCTTPAKMDPQDSVCKPGSKRRGRDGLRSGGQPAPPTLRVVPKRVVERPSPWLAMESRCAASRSAGEGVAEQQALSTPCWAPRRIDNHLTATVREAGLVSKIHRDPASYVPAARQSSSRQRDDGRSLAVSGVTTSQERCCRIRNSTG